MLTCNYFEVTSKSDHCSDVVKRNGSKVRAGNSATIIHMYGTALTKYLNH